MPIKAVFTDMDGTLLNPHHKVSDYTISVIKGLKEKGIYFIVATGRPYADVFPTIRNCGLEPDYIITCNGARVHDSNFQLVSAQNMDPKFVQQVAQMRFGVDAEGHSDAAHPVPKRFATNLYREAEWLADYEIPEITPGFDQAFKCNVLGSKLHEMTEKDCENVHQIWFLGEPAALAPFETFMNKTYGQYAHCTFSLPDIVDCVSCDVNKGRAVTAVAEKLGISLEDAVCFGDGMNDVSMLKIVGMPFIMSNSGERLRKELPRVPVIGSNAEDGVAKKLAELVETR